MTPNICSIETWIGLAAEHLASDKASTPFISEITAEVIMVQPTQEELHKLFRYVKTTGELVWKLSLSNNSSVGGTAGWSSSDGYWRVGIMGRDYKRSRVVYCWHHGYFPEGNVDHINRLRHDDRIENLREVSQQCNLRNYGNPVDNTSGVKGVTWVKKHCKWHAYINVNRKNTFLGYYSSFYDAVCARLTAEQCLGWSNCDSSSPAYIYVRENIINREEK